MFALLANVMLLAHSVIPHHHHGDVVCFEVGHCTVCETAHVDDCDANHSSDSPVVTDENCCALDHMVMFHPDGLRHDLEDAGHPAEMDFQQDFFAALIQGYFDFSQFAGNLPFRQHPPAPAYHHACLGQGPGLRAPPLV